MSSPSLKVAGHLTLTALYSDGRQEVLSDAHNQVTYGYLEALVELLGQRSTFKSAEQNGVHSIWFEAAAADIPDPAPTDTTYGPGVTIVDQVVIEDTDRDASVVGNTRVLSVTAYLDAGVGTGQTIRAAGLYTRGTSDTPPSSVGFVSGDDGVTLIARQKTAPILKGDFVVIARWMLSFDIA